MRIDLENNDERPLFFRAALFGVKRALGTPLGPLLTLSYKRDFIASTLRRYIARGTSGAGPWTKGECELFAAFVSSLNSCHF